MNNNNNKNPLTEKEAMKKALKRKTRYRMPSVNIGVLIVTVILFLIIGVCTLVIISRNDDKAPLVTGSSLESATVENAVDEEKPKATEISVAFPQSAIHEGELILVNADHEFVFPDVRDDVSVYDNKTLSYKVGDMNVTLSMTAITAFNKLMDDFYAETGCRDVMIVSGGGFRTEEFQRQLYSNRVATDGAEMAAKYVALPGHSEHHTGLAMDLSVYTDAGEGYAVRAYEKCKWLVENFENYGFILRYPEEKSDITGISYESWHYRYVGLPHSLIMKEKGWVLEEYIEYLRNLPEGTAISWNGIASEEISLEGIHGGDYVVYYVPANETGDTEIKVPKNREYTVSGDNVGGFIVTLNGGHTNE
ncbi:MAG: D-alanyl-D-alanine carboxypeptidase family protein [Ruminococcaceae bacterium]|nr:D-alanyl-D-alanine carboxypeptidase family protein [Oscillospiraceae bacterium]